MDQQSIDVFDLLIRGISGLKLYDTSALGIFHTEANRFFDQSCFVWKFFYFRHTRLILQPRLALSTNKLFEVL